jgi:hypothetical protein
MSEAPNSTTTDSRGPCPPDSSVPPDADADDATASTKTSTKTMSLQGAAAAPAKATAEATATEIVSQESSRSPSAAQSPQPPPPPPPPVHDFDTPLQFLEALMPSHDHDDHDHDDHNNNHFTVVKHYASYCKICQRAGIQYQKIAVKEQQAQAHIQAAQARQNNDSSLPPPLPPSPPPPLPRIDFYQLDAGRLLSGDTLKQLGVTKFPFCQIFVRGDCVASFGLSTGGSGGGGSGGSGGGGVGAAAAAHLFGQRVRDTLDTCLARTEDEWETFRTDFAVPIQDNRSARAAVQESLELDNNNNNNNKTID